MSPKWLSSYSLSFDMADTKNIGGLLRITRVGESLLVSGGFTYDPARNSVGAVFSVEPRAQPRSQLGQIGNTQLPPAGANGLD
jgi:hypothetical protein